MDLPSEIEEGAVAAPCTSELPELFSLQLQNKLYNTRLQNQPGDLQQIISGATKHIHDITRLLLSLSKYRADTMGAIGDTVNQMINSTTRDTTSVQHSNASQEGILGQRPSNLTSVAELMLNDTETNVYEDRIASFHQETVFNIRGRKQKVLSKKEKEKLEQQKQLQIKKKAIQKAIVEKRNIAAAPESFNKNN